MTILEVLSVDCAVLPSSKEVKNLNNIVTTLGKCEIPLSEVKISDIAREDGSIPTDRVEILNAVSKLDFTKKITTDYGVLDKIVDEIKVSKNQSNLRKAVELTDEAEKILTDYRSKIETAYKLLGTDINEQVIEGIKNVEKTSSFRLYSAKAVNGMIKYVFATSSPVIVGSDRTASGTHNLGYFLAEIYTKLNGCVSSDGEGEYERVRMLYDNVINGNGQYHPHVTNSGTLCYGTGNARVAVARKTGDISQILMALDSLIRSDAHDDGHYLKMNDVKKLQFNRRYSATKDQCEFLGVPFIDGMLDVRPAVLKLDDALYKLTEEAKGKYKGLDGKIIKPSTTSMGCVLKDSMSGLYIAKRDLVVCEDVVSTKDKVFKIGDIIHFGDKEVKHVAKEDLLEPVTEVTADHSFLYEKSTGSIVVCQSGSAVYKIYIDDDYDVAINGVENLADLYDVVTLGSSKDNKGTSIPECIYATTKRVTLKLNDEEGNDIYKDIVTTYDNETNKIGVELVETDKPPRKRVIIKGA